MRVNDLVVRGDLWPVLASTAAMAVGLAITAVLHVARCVGPSAIERSLPARSSYLIDTQSIGIAQPLKAEPSSTHKHKHTGLESDSLALGFQGTAGGFEPASGMWRWSGVEKRRAGTATYESQAPPARIVRWFCLGNHPRRNSCFHQYSITTIASSTPRTIQTQRCRVIWNRIWTTTTRR